MFENRFYRRHHQKKGLISFNIIVKETSLNIQAQTDLTDLAVTSVLTCRNYIENYIRLFPDFAASLVPIQMPGPVPAVIRDMIDAGRQAGVGPMAAVAGVVAEYTGKALLARSSEVLVENGGDIFVKSDSETIFSIYAGNSPFSMTTGIRVARRKKAYGMCTSSGMFGHSKSFGMADAAVVLSDSCSLADAAATALGNRVRTEADIEAAMTAGKSIPGVQGIVIIKNEQIGLWGDITLVNLSG